MFSLWNRFAATKPSRTFRRSLGYEALEGRRLLAVYSVQSVADTGGLAATGGAGTLLDPFQIATLRSALEQANADPGSDTIVFEDGSASGGTNFLDATSDTITLGGMELSITASVTITGTGETKLTFDANGQSRIFNVDDGNNSNLLAMAISGVTLTGGKASDDSGGAIYSLENLTLNDSTIRGNAAAIGGGIFNDFGTLAINHSTIADNTSDSTAVLADGGGVLNGGNGTLNMTDCTISGNKSLSATGDAGGIDNLLGGVVMLKNCTITGNSAAENAGGIGNTGTMTIINCTIANNQAGGSGGGIGDDGTITIKNSTISMNSAESGGGGAFYTHGGDSTTIQNSTLSGNTASTGGGIYSYNLGTTALANSIVAGNIATTSDPDFSSLGSGATTVKFSLIGDNSGSGLNEAHSPDANGNLVGNAAGGGIIKPLLAALGNYGGPTQTMALQPGSPAINAGHNADVPGDVTTDQRGSGFARIVGGTVDIGAYEAQAPTASLTGSAAGVPGQTLSFKLFASHTSPPAIPGKFTFVVNWGDGSQPQTIVALSGVTVTHAFIKTGNLLVKVQATDSAKGISAVATKSVQLSTVSVAGKVLFVGGGSGRDVITITPSEQTGKSVRVVVGSQTFGPYVPSEVVVFGNGGNDSLTLASLKSGTQIIRPNVPVRLFGGTGNDLLDASANLASSVLEGGSGNDRLTGSATARDILIGGAGRDALLGGGGDDILIAGSTTRDDDVAALDVLLAAWNGKGTYVARVKALLQGSPTRPKLDKTTVFDDAAADSLDGQTGNDWFFATLTGSKIAQDIVKNRTATETLTVQGPRPV